MGETSCKIYLAIRARSVVPTVGPVGREVAPQAGRTTRGAHEEPFSVEVRTPIAGLEDESLRRASLVALRPSENGMFRAVNAPWPSGVCVRVCVRV